MISIRVLGPGCSKCTTLYRNVQSAVELSGVEATVEKVTDIVAILEFGVVRTPALVIDGKIELVGQVPSVEEIQKLLA